MVKDNEHKFSPLFYFTASSQDVALHLQFHFTHTSLVNHKMTHLCTPTELFTYKGLVLLIINIKLIVKMCIPLPKLIIYLKNSVKTEQKTTAERNWCPRKINIITAFIQLQLKVYFSYRTHAILTVVCWSTKNKILCLNPCYVALDLMLLRFTHRERQVIKTLCKTADVSELPYNNSDFLS